MHIRFDDRQSRRSYEFRGNSQVVEANTLDQVVPVLTSIESEVAAGRWAAGFVSYEAAPAFDEALTVRASPGGTDRAPLAWFAVFDQRVEAPPIRPAPYHLTPWTAREDRTEYEDSMVRIRSLIEAGETYQVNYTYRQTAGFEGDPQGFYADLLAAQTASYGAYLDTGRWQILSASPEMFFQRRGHRLVTRPMKGTAPRGRWSEEDLELLAALQASDKERAENVMIVDLLRNDLGRIAEFGSVRVDELWAAEQYETLWQLVSTVSADLRQGTTVLDIFRALFPCGSVTGAPKVRTMEIIADLERDPRGVYCGAIGMLAPPGSEPPELSFSVAIRTVTIDRAAGAASYGVGGGITHDSRIDQEYAETRTKARVLIRKPADFTLVETMKWEPGAGYWYLKEHLDRLEASARYCGYGFRRPAVEDRLLAAAAGFGDTPQRVRLSLDQRGDLLLAFEVMVDHTKPVRVAVDDVPVDPTDWRLFHKTSMRNRYEQALRRHPEADDVLLVNNRGEVTEATVANVVVRKGSRWFTPPLSCGCLPGVMRGALLERGEVSEAPILVSDLGQVDQVELVNSVRGRVPAILVDAAGVTEARRRPG
jgi:para-aminobenzoate synthetase/4-amino-4-deoxychorismate lyase